ncbi:hypothetical protein LOAG_11098 [Loa loa]|uniref:Uncharacterized protein n=1 Tax=Loa loa TaxID=7209 RepID=A0A1S0TQ35_LOALO|nr:hypothetical protein LOAG_11098 [Loa loa]EFO17402.1 hypothetical protein LOAG_11098 [Loa loa]
MKYSKNDTQATEMLPFEKKKHLSHQESDECISKQAYYDVGSNSIAIISLDKKCDEILTNAFEKAMNKPENLKIKIIKNPKDFEHLLRVVQDICFITTIQESTRIYVTWFFFDCTKNEVTYKKKEGVMWIILLSLTIVAIIICVAIGVCCYLAFRMNNFKPNEKHDSSKKEQTSNENADELSDKSINIKSPSAVSYLENLI